MAIEIGALRALLSLDSTAFEKGAKRAQASMNRLQRSLTQIGERMGATGRKLTTRLTVPLAGISAVAVRSSLKTIDAQSKMAQSLDTSTRSMQVLARAADRAGISTGELEQIGRQLTKRLSQAAGGAGPAAEALERMGLRAADLADLDLDQRISVINRAIEETIPAAEQAAVAAQVFGDRAGLLASRLDADTIARANAEIERFGLAVTEIQADQIEAANDAISGLGLVTRGLANQMTVALAPTLRRIAERVADLGSWFSDLSPRMKRLVVILGSIAAAAGPAAIAIGLLATALGAISLPLAAILAVGAAAGGIWLTLSENTTTAEEAMRAAEEAQKALNAAMGTFYETAAPSSAREAIEAANANIELAKSARDAARAEIAKREAQLSSFEGSISTARQQGLQQGAEEALAKARAQLEQAKALLEEAERAQKRAARAVLGTMTFETEQAAQATNDLRVQVEGLGDAAAGAGGKIAVDLGGGLDGVQQKMSGVESAFTGLGDRLASAFTDAITGARKLSDALGQLLAQLGNRLLSSVFNSLISSIMPEFAKGGVIAGGRVMPFADGGVVSSPTYFPMRGGTGLMGESGPEAIMPLRRGSDGKLGVQSQGGAPARVEVVASVENGNIVQTIREVSGDVAARTMQAGLKEYDRRVLPSSVGRINGDPRRRG